MTLVLYAQCNTVVYTTAIEALPPPSIDAGTTASHMAGLGLVGLPLFITRHLHYNDNQACTSEYCM